MTRYEAIPHSHWVNVHTGQKVSKYGSLPYVSKAGEKDWELRAAGFVIRDNNHNTTGNAYSTWEAAAAAADKWNAEYNERKAAHKAMYPESYRTVQS